MNALASVIRQMVREAATDPLALLALADALEDTRLHGLASLVRAGGGGGRGYDNIVDSYGDGSYGHGKNDGDGYVAGGGGDGGYGVGNGDGGGNCGVDGINSMTLPPARSFLAALLWEDMGQQRREK